MAGNQASSVKKDKSVLDNEQQYGIIEGILQVTDPIAYSLAHQEELWNDTPSRVTAADLNLDAPQTVFQGMTLKANLPSVLTLQGSSDLYFSSFSVAVTARKLERNMAESYWGSVRSGDSDKGDQQVTEILLPSLTPIDVLAIRTAKKGQTAVFEKKENGYYSSELNVPANLSEKKDYFGYKQVGWRTDSVRVSKPKTGSMKMLLRSPSLPARIGIAIVDDSPVQVIPSEMTEDGTVVSRDLAGQIYAAWQRAKPSADGFVRVQLKLTSMTDGLADIEIKGVWGRYQSSAPISIPLNPFHPARVPVPWPFKKQIADVRLAVSGKLAGGIRRNLVDAPGDFCVRTGEKLEVAQSFLLAEGPEITELRQVSAVWLCLPSVPTTEEKIELRIAKAVGNPLAPSDELIARAVTALPADSASYILKEGVFWFRAAFDPPAYLDGALMTQSLFVVAAGRAEGTLLCHMGAGESAAGRVPARAGETGASLFRNLARSSTWEQQNFNRQASFWVMDLELVPLPEEYGAAVRISPSHQPGLERKAFFTGPAATAPDLEWPHLPVPPVGQEFAFVVTSSMKGSLTAEVKLYHPIKQ
ncbi:hypothetical protein E5161_07140 [Cohnella pontilimi]|uniref:Uncharacterized protein n=1 Tax=Cohnella pontilimi TaxID=2564100 RepID=A0A4U0FCY7_9BACL|nr:hypothetical protein [Cohnella pontilimi]TJY42620.1 hypothetical protein E5161_07140 [Cohnella pontilimi]